MVASDPRSVHQAEKRASRLLDQAMGRTVENGHAAKRPLAEIPHPGLARPGKVQVGKIR